MEWFCMVPVSLLLIRAVYTDVKKGIIENRLVAVGLFTGLLLSFAAGGGRQLLESVKSAVIMLMALFLIYFIGGIGAGDVKLLCMLATFFNRACLGIAVVAFFVAALISIGRMGVRLLRKEKIYQRGETLKFSIPVAIATVIVFVSEVGKCGL